jgi:hypothetical protein
LVLGSVADGEIGLDGAVVGALVEAVASPGASTETSGISFAVELLIELSSAHAETTTSALTTAPHNIDFRLTWISDISGQLSEARCPKGRGTAARPNRAAALTLG